jgi:hypothetical protein
MTTSLQETDDSEKLSNLLADWFKSWVKLEGVYRAHKTIALVRKSHPVVLLQDITVTLPTRASYTFDHTWVQNAGGIIAKGPSKGDQVKCEALVNCYPKKDRPSEVRHGLYNPKDVIVTQAKQIAFTPQQPGRGERRDGHQIEAGPCADESTGRGADQPQPAGGRAK